MWLSPSAPGRAGTRSRPGLALEALERRDCPRGVITMERDHTLFVTGDAAANEVRVEDFGNGTVVVSSRGAIVGPIYKDVGAIIVQLGGGGDRVEYKRAPHPTSDMDARFFTGAGADTVEVLAGPDGGTALAAAVTSKLYVATGDGADVVTWAPELAASGEQKVQVSAVVDAGGGDDTVHAFPGFNVPPGSTLDCDVTVYGRAGDDVIDAAFTGQDARAAARLGALRVSLDAGPGDNFIMDRYGDLIADALDVNLRSEAGADQVSLAAHGVTVLHNATVGVTTGGGTDALMEVFGADMEIRGDFTNKTFTGGGNDRAIIAIAGHVGGQTALSYSGAGGNDFLDASGVSFQSPNVPQVLLNGDEGNDVIIGTSDPDILHGGPGNDYIAGGPGGDIIHGDQGNDKLYGADGSDIISGGDGKDYIGGGTGGDIIDGGKGDDELYGADGLDIIHGGDGADRIAGGTDDDMLYGDGGNDEIYGADGNDLLDGGGGLDYLSGGSGSDILRGGGADLAEDELVGGPGADTFYEAAPPWADLLSDFDAAEGDSKI